MKQYKISKLGKNTDNSLAELSTFGDSQEFFQGYSYEPPTVGERFTLRYGKLGGIVISTSMVVEIGEGEFSTVYSRYSVEEV